MFLLRHPRIQYSAVFVCLIVLVLQTAHAESSVSPEDIISLIDKIQSLKTELDDLQSQLEEMQKNGTKTECDCEKLKERLENLKSKLEEWEKIVNATSTECDCKILPPPVLPLNIGDFFLSIAISAAFYGGGATLAFAYRRFVVQPQPANIGSPVGVSG